MVDLPRQGEGAATLEAMIESRDVAGIAHWLDSCQGAEAVRTLSSLSDESREQMLQLLTPEDAADVIEQLPEPQALDALGDLDPAQAARIIEELPSDEQADLLGEMDEEEADAILRALPAEDADEVRRLAAYEADVAGGLMITEFVSYPASASVAIVLDDLAANATTYTDYDIQYAYVTGDKGELVVVLPLRTLLLAPRTTLLSEIMLRDPVRVPDTMGLADLATLFKDLAFVGLPVVDSHGRLVGVVRRSGVEHALVEESDETYRASLGIVGGEELRSMPLMLRSRRRLGWLSINILLNVMAASIIAMYQETLEAVIALAVFLPIISDMSGCSGNQAVAVSMRELTLGVAQPRDAMRVVGKELSVGALNGVVLGILLAGVAYLWKGNIYLGVVVGSALMLNTMVSVTIGGGVPLLLKGLKKDPALASGPILTTITDMCGFFFTLSFAAVMLKKLTIAE